MPTKYQSHIIRYLRGVNEDENPNALDANELSESLNIWSLGTAKGTRPGAVRDGDSFVANVTGPVQGGVEYRSTNDSVRKTVVVSGGDVLVDSTPTSIKGAATITTGAGNSWTFAQHAQRVYAAGGAAGDTFWYWANAGNVNAITMKDLANTTIYPRYVFQKWNRLFTAGFRYAGGTLPLGEASSNPMVGRYSELNIGTSWPLSNTIGGTSTIGGLSAEGDEFITGYGEFTDNSGDWLLILTNKRLYAVVQTGNAINPFTVSAGRGAIQNGCVHQNAFVSLGLDSGDAVYLSNQGIHSLRQSQQYGALERTFLSWKIRRTFETLNQGQLSGAVGTYWRERGIVLFFVPTGSDNQNLLGLALDVKGKSELTADSADWDIWKLGGETASIRGVNALWPGRNSSNKYLIYGGNEQGDVFTFNSSSNSDLGVSYSTVLQTKHDDYGAPSLDKGLGDIYLTIRGSGTHRPSYRTIFDYGTDGGPSRSIDMIPGGAAWNVAQWNVDQWGAENPIGVRKLYGLGSGETIAHRISHTGASEPWNLVSVNAQLRLRKELTETQK